MNHTIALSQTSDSIKYTAVVYAVFATVFGSLMCCMLARLKVERTKLKVTPI